GNDVSPRATVCVVNTVTTLGATFSTIGANVAVIPSRVGAGVDSCAAAAKTLASTQRIVTTKNARDLTIRLCIIPLFQKRIACSTTDGLFLRIANQSETRVSKKGGTHCQQMRRKPPDFLSSGLSRGQRPRLKQT